LAIKKRLISLLTSHTDGNQQSIHPHDLEKTHKYYDAFEELRESMLEEKVKREI